MIEFFIPATVSQIIVYSRHIDPRWGPERLRNLCEQELDVRLEPATAVLFHNRAQDTLILVAQDDDGDRTVTKRLERGAFLLPAPDPGRGYATVRPSQMNSLFR